MRKNIKPIFVLFLFTFVLVSGRIESYANTYNVTFQGENSSLSYNITSNTDVILIDSDPNHQTYSNGYVCAYSLSPLTTDPNRNWGTTNGVYVTWNLNIDNSTVKTSNIPLYRTSGYTSFINNSLLDEAASILHGNKPTTFTKVFSEGSIDNPILDENIGTLILDKTIMYEESNGNDINDLYNLWSWKNKTSTGYSLSDNDYAQTFIQVKVESKCVIYSDLRHTKVKQNFDNYGEKGMLFNQIPVNNQPLKVSYLKDVPKALPLTHAESHNPLYVGYNYTLYFRVVCTNSTQVIPDDSSSEWHCGGWRAMDCNGDVLNGQSDKSSNGHFDDDDNWIADEDDGNNDVTSGSDSVHDTDDAKDSFANYQPSSGMSTDTAIGNLKDLMNMVGYIPTMIATLFSFLPSWCTTLIGVTFASMLVLIVYKLIRG